MQQAINSKRIKIARVNFFLLLKDSGSKPHGSQRKWHQSVGGRFVNLCGQSIEKPRLADQAQTSGACTGLKKRATRLMEHRGSPGEVSHGSGRSEERRVGKECRSPRS